MSTTILDDGKTIFKNHVFGVKALRFCHIYPALITQSLQVPNATKYVHVLSILFHDVTCLITTTHNTIWLKLTHKATTMTAADNKFSKNLRFMRIVRSWNIMPYLLFLKKKNQQI